MKLLVVNNLAAGFQDGMVYDYLRLVAQDGDEICLRVTDGTTDVALLVDDARAFDAVAVAGGDGTIASVAYRLADSGIPILPIPTGTGNLLASNLLSPLEPHGLAAMTHSLHTLDFDMGECEVAGKRSGFCIMAGAGYDATIMEGAKPTKKTLGALAYFQAALSNPSPQRSKIGLTIDGKKIRSRGLGVIIANFSHIQFDIPLIPDTNPRDGVMEAAVLKADDAFGLIPALMGAIRDRDGEHPDRSDSLELYRGQEMTVVADPPFQVQYDGETPDATTPLTLRVLPRAARFILSPQGFDHFTD